MTVYIRRSARGWQWQSPTGWWGYFITPEVAASAARRYHKVKKADVVEVKR